MKKTDGVERAGKIGMIRSCAVLAVMIGCVAAPPEYVGADVERVPAIGDIPQRTTLEQNWSGGLRQRFWFTSQGARILPYDWFVWLEQADSRADDIAYFRDASNMERLRYLPEESSDLNPGGLPIGFALDDSKDAGAWMGLTCAACHTNQLDYGGKHYLIEGAPTLASFVAFLNELIEALQATQSDPAKFDRFTKNVIGADASSDEIDALRERLSEIGLALAEREAVNALPDGYPEDFTSYGRLDAFGNIQNAASAFALDDTQNRHAPTAPVSYPFLWGTHQSDVVQWNGSAPNTAVVGPLVRNVGEVVGVFGSLRIRKAPWWKFWRKIETSSTVDMIGLGLLESWVKTLTAPGWAAGFPAIDDAKAARGEEIFGSRCAGCHQVVAPEDQFASYTAKMVALDTVGTDPQMAINAAGHEVKTLFLEGTRRGVIFGEKFDVRAPALDIAVNGAIGILLNDPTIALRGGLIPEVAAGSEQFDALTSGEETERLEDEEIEGYVDTFIERRADLEDLIYKARPLNGIWATAPYLHNGSVPTLWEMLKPAEERIEEFKVGSREFDPTHVGYRTDVGPSTFRVRNATGEIQPGNSNRGHEFANGLDESQRWALLEYLKTL